MINLMYVVLMAMLALNVSTDVLNGFTLVDEMLNRSVGISSSENQALMSDIQLAMDNNPAVAKQWYDKAQKVKKESDALYK